MQLHFTPFPLSVQHFRFITPHPLGVAEYCDEHVCLSVCERISATTHPTFTKFVANVICGGDLIGPPLAATALRYVLSFRFTDDFTRRSTVPATAHIETRNESFITKHSVCRPVGREVRWHWHSHDF